MIKFKLDLTVEEQEGHGEKGKVRASGPLEVIGTGTNDAEVLALANALGMAIEKLMPAIEALPGNGPLNFAEALNRPFMEWAQKR